MSGMWKRSHGGTIEAPPDERGGNRYVLPNATAPHLDSTKMRNTPREQMFSVSPPNSDIPRCGRHERSSLCRRDEAVDAADSPDKRNKCLPQSRRKRGEVKTGENNNSSRFQRTAIGETVEPVAPRILSAVIMNANSCTFFAT